MKKFILGLALVTTASSFAFAAAKYEITGSCLEKIEKEIDKTNTDESGCVKGANVDSVDSAEGDVYSVSYSRDVCEGYVNGSADVTLNVTRKSTSGSKTRISGCEVLKLEITDESGD